jgi:hypothetical protein
MNLQVSQIFWSSALFKCKVTLCAVNDYGKQLYFFEEFVG